MEIYYSHPESYTIDPKLGLEFTTCPDVVVRVRGAIPPELQIFETGALVLEHAKCSFNLDKVFLSATSVTTEGEVDENCFKHLTKIERVTINWPDSGFGNYDAVMVNIGEQKLLDTIRILGIELTEKQLNVLATTAKHYNELSLNCGKNRKAVFSFMQNNVPFNKITLIFADVDSGILDYAEFFKEVESNTKGLLDFEKNRDKKTNWFIKMWKSWFKNAKSAENFCKMWRKVPYLYADARIGILRFEVCIF